MAWYHVGGCDCPMGCCDCGSGYTPTKYPFVASSTKVFKKDPPKGKCTGCGLKSQDAICWRCSTVLEEMSKEIFND